MITVTRNDVSRVDSRNSTQTPLDSAGEFVRYNLIMIDE